MTARIVTGIHPKALNHMVFISCMPVTPMAEVDMGFVELMSDWCGRNCKHPWQLGVGAALFSDMSEAELFAANWAASVRH